jgi:hypothetical protein
MSGDPVENAILENVRLTIDKFTTWKALSSMPEEGGHQLAQDGGSSTALTKRLQIDAEKYRLSARRRNYP